METRKEKKKKKTQQIFFCCYLQRSRLLMLLQIYKSFFSFSSADVKIKGKATCQAVKFMVFSSY